MAGPRDLGPRPRATHAVRLLLPDDDFTAGLAAVRGLRARGYEPWLAVSSRGVYAARSRATAGTVLVPDAERDPDGFLERLLATARELDIAAILPGTESALTVLASRLNGDRHGTLVAMPPAEIVARVRDKRVLAETAGQIGLRTPDTIPFTRDAVPGLPYPAVVKPARSSFESNGGIEVGWVRRVASPAELDTALASIPGDELLAQPFLAGSLAAVCGVIWEGKLICASHQVARRIWPPDCGISAYAETVPRDAELEHRSADLLTELGWSGLFELQFIRSDEGVYLIDLNTRFYGSLALAVAAGLNLPAIWVDLLLDRKPLVGAYRPGVRYRSEERDVKAIAALLRRGRWAAATQALVPRRRTVHAIFSLRDPVPFAARVAQLGGNIVSARVRGSTGPAVPDVTART